MGTPTLIYDGDCDFCTSTAKRISRRWRAGGPQAVAWQRLDDSELRQLGLDEEQLRAAAYWIDEAGRASGGHLAVGHALSAAGGWRAVLGAAIRRPPLSWLARPGYWLVARYRRYLPGAGSSIS